MKQKNIRFIIGLMAIALLGVMAMQYYFICESYRLKSQLFDQNISEALSVISKKIEKRDAILFLRRKKVEDRRSKKLNSLARVLNPSVKKKQHFSKPIKLKEQKIRRDLQMRDSLLRLQYPHALLVDNDFFETYLKNFADIDKVHLSIRQQQFMDPHGNIYQDEVRELYVDDVDQKKMLKAKDDSIRYLVEEPLGFTLITLPNIVSSKKHDKEKEEQQVEKACRDIDSVKTVKRKINVLVGALEDLAKELTNVPLKNRIDNTFVDSLIRAELLSRGIELAYSYEVHLINSDTNNSLTKEKLSNTKKKFANRRVYSTILFPSELIHERGILSLSFPNKPNLLMSNMKMLLVSSVGLLFVLVSCFAYTMLVILRQKKLSEMKTDFINNMTHEFKTPVSTIMIASEALQDSEIVKDKKRLNRLAGIIYDENARLGNHIERVLNIARMEEGDLHLEYKKIEINELISAVVDSMSLQLQKNQAKVFLELHAREAVIWGDELHLSNVIFNLIDNANKYSTSSPNIVIQTYNLGKKLIIKIIDQGIGMNKDQLSKIFDQFYRIPTGNIHNVKGFGLGLSYVSDIVKRFRGTITVKSEKNKGSEFEIRFIKYEEASFS